MVGDISPRGHLAMRPRRRSHDWAQRRDWVGPPAHL